MKKNYTENAGEDLQVITADGEKFVLIATGKCTTDNLNVSIKARDAVIETKTKTNKEVETLVHCPNEKQPPHLRKYYEVEVEMITYKIYVPTGNVCQIIDNKDTIKALLLHSSQISTCGMLPDFQENSIADNYSVSVCEEKENEIPF